LNSVRIQRFAPSELLSVICHLFKTASCLPRPVHIEDGFIGGENVVPSGEKATPTRFGPARRGLLRPRGDAHESAAPCRQAAR